MCVENKREPHPHLMPRLKPVGGTYSASAAAASMHSGQDSPDMSSSGDTRHANRTTHRVSGLVAARQLTHLSMGVDGVVVGWRSTRGRSRRTTRSNPHAPTGTTSLAHGSDCSSASRLGAG